MRYGLHRAAEMFRESTTCAQSGVGLPRNVWPGGWFAFRAHARGPDRLVRAARGPQPAAVPDSHSLFVANVQVDGRLPAVEEMPYTPRPPSSHTHAENLALRKELERFQARLELALGAWQFDIESGRVTWTPTLEKIHGLEPGSFGGTFDDYQNDIHPEDQERVLETLRSSLSGQSPHYLLYRIIRPDGEIRWLEATGKLIESDGRPVQLMGVCCDVTERVAAEEQRRALLVAKEEALRARDDLLAMVSHDLRNPLNLISICTQAIDAHAGQNNVRIGKEVERIQRAVCHMSDLIANLLDAASIETGAFDVERVRTKVSTLLADSVDAIAPLAANKQVVVKAECDDADAEVQCDGERIRQVLGNLLGNAVKFAPKDSRVTVAARGTGDSYVFSVSDQGPGIPAENTKLVFDRYWKGKQSGRAGTGLGLYIAKGIVEAHGGKMTLQSVVGEGSTFSFSIAG